MGHTVTRLVAVLDPLRSGVPLPFRKQYRDKLYPDITLERLQNEGSPQQVEIFARYYGVGIEPQETSVILAELGIKTSNHVTMQLTRIEDKLGSTKSQRLRLQRKYKKEYYKAYRPKCPHCKVYKARQIGNTEDELKWLCGNRKCKKQFRTPGDGRKIPNKYEIRFTFADNNRDRVGQVQVKKDGVIRSASGSVNVTIEEKEDIAFDF
jgi:hypothetical protein